MSAGGYAEFAIRTVNGRPAGDACGEEIDYTGLSVRLAGAWFPLRGTSIEVTCPHAGSGGMSGMELAGWDASIWPTPEGARITRAPAP